jgi:hypothetical protein
LINGEVPLNPELVNLLGELKETEQMQLLAKDVVILSGFQKEIRGIADGSD